jgi:hypothetical protein
MCVRLLNHLLHLVGLGHVKSEGKDSVAETFLQIVHVGEFASGGSDLIATFESGFSPYTAEAARGACNEPCFLHIDSPEVESVCCGARREAVR